jgi:Fe-S cluster assembly iron-binding protein IscA
MLSAARICANRSASEPLANQSVERGNRSAVGAPA